VVGAGTDISRAAAGLLELVGELATAVDLLGADGEVHALLMVSPAQALPVKPEDAIYL
jgi:hypothetical protein